MTQLTTLGLYRTRLDERLGQMQTSYRSVYGEDIAIDADDIDGQWLGILAESISNLDQLLADIYASFDPTAANGKSLSTLVQLNGIRRIAGARSLVSGGVTVIGQQGVVIPVGSLIRSNIDNSLWQTLDAVTIPASGTVTIQNVQAMDMGPLHAPVGSLTKIGSPIYGWQSVTNTVAAVVGRYEESDEELRQRRKGSTSTSAQSIVDAIYGGLANLPDVRLVRVLENYTDEVDANGLPPHSIQAVVEGGDPAQIALMIYLKRSAGVTMVGLQAVTVIDSQGIAHVINFDRPTYVPAYIVVNVVRLPGYPPDGAQQMVDALVAYGNMLKIGEALLNSRLYDAVNTVPNHYVTSILTANHEDPTTEANIPVGVDELVRIDPANIVIAETVP